MEGVEKLSIAGKQRQGGWACAQGPDPSEHPSTGALWLDEHRSPPGTRFRSLQGAKVGRDAFRTLSRRSKDHGPFTSEDGSLVRRVLRVPWGELGEDTKGAASRATSSQDAHVPGHIPLSQHKPLTGPCNICY